MSVSKLAEILKDPQQAAQVQLVDVREDVEARISSLPEFQIKPLSRYVCVQGNCGLGWLKPVLSQVLAGCLTICKRELPTCPDSLYHAALSVNEQCQALQILSCMSAGCGSGAQQ